MKEIKGQKILTITAVSGDEYTVKYESGFKADIKNATDGDIYISSKNDFTDTDNVGNYVVLSSGECYNGLVDSFGKLYIKSDGGGRITIVRCA